MVSTAMDLASRLSHEASDSDQERIRNANALDRPDEHRDGAAGAVVSSVTTPNRFGPRSVSPASSSSSSSGKSGVFDTPSSVHTPNTPPCDCKAPIRETKASSSSTSEKSVRNTRHRPRVSGDSLSSPVDVDDWNKHAEVDDSPTKPKQHRRPQLEHRKGVNELIMKVGFLHLEENDAASSKWREISDDDPMSDISPETPHQVSSEDSDSDIDMPDVNEHDHSEEFGLHVETNGEDVAEDAPRSKTKDTSTSDESNREAVAPSPVETRSTRAPARYRSTKPAQSPLHKQSNAEACSNTAPRKQSTSRDRISSPASSCVQAAPRRKPSVPKLPQSTDANDSPSCRPAASSLRPKGRKTSPPIESPPRAEEVHDADADADAAVRLQASPTARPSSTDGGQEEESATSVTGVVGPAVIEEAATSRPGPETIGDTQELSGAEDPRFERYLPQRNRSGPKGVVLEALRHRTKWTEMARLQLALIFPRILLEWLERARFLKVKPTDGYIYIFTSENYKGYIKIGVTTRQTEKRIGEWRKQCKIECTPVEDPNINRFFHCKIVERIVQAELHNERRTLQCENCGKKHKEWFKISAGRALQIVERWRSWVIQHEPYSPQGVLRDFWKIKYKDAMECDLAWENWDLVEEDWWSFQDYVLRYFTTGVRALALILLAAIFAPSHTTMILHIFFRFGFVMGGSVLFLVCLLFLSFNYKFT